MRKIGILIFEFIKLNTLTREKNLDIRSKYKQTAQIYDKRYREIQQQKIDVLFKEYPIRVNKFVLDVGCGTGLVFEFLHRSLKIAVGVDFSVEMLRQTRKKFLNSSFHWIVADGEHLPFRPGLFDHIFFITSLQNMGNQVSALKEAHAACKSQGNMYLSVLRKNNAPAIINSILKQLKYSVIREYDLDDLEDYMKIMRKI